MQACSPTVAEAELASAATQAVGVANAPVAASAANAVSYDQHS